MANNKSSALLLLATRGKRILNNMCDYFDVLPFSSLVFFLSAIAASIVDIKTLRIPDPFWFSPLIFAIIEVLLIDVSLFPERLIISTICLLILLVFRKAVAGKMGLGDVKFIAASSFAFGYFFSLIVLIASSVLGILYLCITKKTKARIPFAPFLAIGIFITLLLKFSCS